ncbi:hypothetical protein BH11ACT7_BH11ACT7_35190 [soil metagenome]
MDDRPDREHCRGADNPYEVTVERADPCDVIGHAAATMNITAPAVALRFAVQSSPNGI